MDPPGRPHARRRPVSSQMAHPAVLQRQTTEQSPTPPLGNIKNDATRADGDPRCLDGTSTVSLEWEQGDDASNSSGRLHLFTQCVESETITTTKVTKRTYPPLRVKDPIALERLNPKEYPLASVPTPAQLANFSYNFGQNSTEKNPATADTKVCTTPFLQCAAWCQYINKDLANLSQAPRSHSLQLHPPQRRNARSVSASKVPPHRGQHSDRILRPQLDRNARKPGRSSSKGMSQSPIARSTKSRGFPLDWDEKGDGQNGHRTIGSRRLGLGVLLSDRTNLPATPEMSELDTSQHEFGQPFRFTDTITPQSGLSQEDESGFFGDLRSPANAVNPSTSACAVATPPIAESDLEPFEQANATFAQAPRTYTAIAANNASLPSPGLSPISTSAELPDRLIDDDQVEDALSPATQDGYDDAADDEQRVETAEHITSQLLEGSESEKMQATLLPTILEAQRMIETFDTIPNELKKFLMFQFLRRCPKQTLKFIAGVVNPALKCDFLDHLPIELSLHVLSFLDYQDLCRAAQVSKQWRNVIDSNETGWKELFDRNGFELPVGELERAISQGWGWQDPHGPSASEKDLSVLKVSSITLDDMTITGVVKGDIRKARPAMKRKRANLGFGSDRAKRRPSGHEFSTKAKELLAKYPYTARYHKSEGPITAANAAAIAVPDPQQGLLSLRKLHLFKSLYRRHHLFRRSWISGDIKPHHMAFPAHPAHVITCLQFDDDKILTGSDDTMIHVYDTKTGALRKKLQGHEGGVWALQYEGNVLVSGSTDRSVRVWDIEKGLCTQVFHGHTSTVRCLQILMPSHTGKYDNGKPVMAPERPLIITGSRDSQLRVWKLPEQGAKRYIQSGPPANDSDCPYFVRSLIGHSHSVRAISAHQDTLVSGSYDNSVRVWKISTGELLHRLQGHTAKVYSVVLDYKRGRCISGSMDNYVKIWDLETGTCLYTLEGHDSLVGLLDLKDDRLVSAAADGTLRIWDPANGVCKSKLTAHTGAITCFQHDSRKIISGSDRTLKMWNVQTGDCLQDLLTDLSGVWQVRFDERRCVAAVQRDNLTFVEVSILIS